MLPPAALADPPPALPDEESRRQLALDQYAILDTAPEFAFDDLARLASLVCQTPISLIGLMDHNRQWLKARVGVPADLTEIPRSLAFCNQIITTGSALHVTDTTTDERFASNPYVVGGAGMRFYAGIPLKTADNYCLGTVCVIDRVPRALTAAQQQALTTIAELVMAQLERRRADLPTLLAAHTGYRKRTTLRLEQLTKLVAHDFKVPLKRLLGLSDQLLGNVNQGDTDAVCEALTVMGSEVGRLQSRVSDLLARVRANELPAEAE